MDDEIWCRVPDYEQLYLVSNYGRFFSYYDNKYIEPYLHKTGYYYVSLTKDGVRKQFRVHRIVALCFCPNSNPEENVIVNHKNENKADNRAANLEWCTAKYNTNYGTCIERRKAALEKAVVCLNFNGDVVAQYKSVAEANLALGKPANDNSIGKVCNRKMRVAFGYKWRYVKDYAPDTRL